MTVRSSRYCSTCGEYMGSFGTDGHVCDPEWTCQTENDADDEWQEYRGETATDAAEKCAASYWSEAQELAQELVVRVREGEAVHVFDVVAEYSLSFTALLTSPGRGETP